MRMRQLRKYAHSMEGLRERGIPAPWKEVLVAQFGHLSRHCMDGLEENHYNLKIAGVQADIKIGHLQNTSKKPKERTKERVKHFLSVSPNGI